MRFTAFAAAASLLAGIASASIVPACLTDADATALVNGFASLITNYSTTVAEKILAPDFSDYSSSINFLTGKTGQSLGDVTFPTLAAFEAGQGPQPAVPFTVLNIWHGCNIIGFRWKSTQAPDTVYGINVQTIIPKNGTSTCSTPVFQIETNYSEFDAAAWVLDIGGTVTFPSPPAPTV